MEAVWVPEDSVKQSHPTSSVLPTLDVNMREKEKFPSPLILCYFVFNHDQQPNLILTNKVPKTKERLPAFMTGSGEENFGQGY